MVGRPWTPLDKVIILKFVIQETYLLEETTQPAYKSALKSISIRPSRRVRSEAYTPQPACNELDILCGIWPVAQVMFLVICSTLGLQIRSLGYPAPLAIKPNQKDFIHPSRRVSIALYTPQPACKLRTLIHPSRRLALFLLIRTLEYSA